MQKTRGCPIYPTPPLKCGDVNSLRVSNGTILLTKTCSLIFTPTFWRPYVYYRGSTWVYLPPSCRDRSGGDEGTLEACVSLTSSLASSLQPLAIWPLTILLHIHLTIWSFAFISLPLWQGKQTRPFTEKPELLPWCGSSLFVSPNDKVMIKR